MSCLHFRVAEAPTVQNLVEAWCRPGPPQPNERINQATMEKLLLQLLNYTGTWRKPRAMGQCWLPAVIERSTAPPV